MPELPQTTKSKASGQPSLTAIDSSCDERIDWKKRPVNDPELERVVASVWSAHMYAWKRLLRCYARETPGNLPEVITHIETSDSNIRQSRERLGKLQIFDLP
jgi:hypothetical protein